MATQVLNFKPVVVTDLDTNKDDKSATQLKLEAQAFEDLKQMAMLQRQIDSYQAAFDVLKDKTKQFMESSNIKTLEIKNTEILNLFGEKTKSISATVTFRKSTEVDVKKYFKLVTEQEFLDSVKVSVTEAKKKLREADYKKCMTDGAGTSAFSVKLVTE